MATYAPTINLVHKVQALLTSPDICIWHFVGACGDVRPFHFWKVEPGEDGRPKAVEPSTSFDNFVDMIDAAYAVIDPLRIEPDVVKPPPGEAVEIDSQTLCTDAGNTIVSRQVLTRHEADTGRFHTAGPLTFLLNGQVISADEFDALWGPTIGAHLGGDGAAMSDAVAAIDVAAARQAAGAD